jgi:hypothetical protein
MGPLKDLPRALPELVDLDLQRSALPPAEGRPGIARVAICQTVEHIVRLHCCLALLLVPAAIFHIASCHRPSCFAFCHVQVFSSDASAALESGVREW